MRVSNILEVEQIFMSFNNPRVNAEMERLIKKLKSEIILLNAFEILKKVEKTLREFQKLYYTKYCYSSLGYMSMRKL
ncbi:transposase [Deferribacter autotrophicus]|uniref:Transposase n=1 Tax=Deferribacter autotrophicus TaxID=500465 RepID=A0A5A8F728_9BACT|nr:integrase core domain-containing protein [Deferribacter autotrophicus]KAA0257636.1 transposase [Deferribacter autotrophicus]